MKTREKVCVFILILVSITAVTVTITSTQGQETVRGKFPESKENKIKTEILENGDPVVDFVSPAMAEIGVDSKRRLRSSKFDLTDKTIPADQIKNFEIHENSYEIQFGGPLSNLRNQPAFPIGKSSHIVIGEIKTAKAFLSNQRNAVYSEFTLEVQEFLYRDDNRTGSFDREITIARWGGKVQFPSGRLLHFGMEGKPLPKVGGRYLLFLEHDKDAESFYAVTAYEIQNGLVVPFDGRHLKGMYIRQYGAMEQYNGMKEGDFVGAVKQAIAKTKSVDSEGTQKQ